jgi:hypothetical protein
MSRIPRHIIEQMMRQTNDQQRRAATIAPVAPTTASIAPIAETVQKRAASIVPVEETGQKSAATRAPANIMGSPSNYASLSTPTVAPTAMMPAFDWAREKQGGGNTVTVPVTVNVTGGGLDRARVEAIVRERVTEFAEGLDQALGGIHQ